MKEKFTWFDARVTLERCREMGNRRIAQHHGDFGNTKPFFIKEVTGMFHTLVLVEVENGSAEKLFEALLEVTLVDSHFTAQLFDGDGLTDMLDEDLACSNDLVAVSFIGQELALEGFDAFVAFFFSEHALKAVQKEHLNLCIDINILHAACVVMIQHSFQHQAGPATKVEQFGERRRMQELEDLVGRSIDRRVCTNELRQMSRRKTEAQNIYCIGAVVTGTGVTELALITLGGFLFAINISGKTEAKLEVILFGLVLAEVIDHHSRILDIPLRMPLVTMDHILNRTRDLLLFFVQQNQLLLHDGLLVSQC